MSLTERLPSFCSAALFVPSHSCADFMALDFWGRRGKYSPAEAPVPEMDLGIDFGPVLAAY